MARTRTRFSDTRGRGRRAPDPYDLGAPRAPRGTVRRVAPPLVAVLCVALALLGLSVAGRGVLSGRSCLAEGISTAAAREGTCVRGGWPDSTPTTYVVVDAGHTLRMPGYSVRLLATELHRYTTADAGVSDPADYPDNQGTLVSFEISVRNAGAAPLAVDPVSGAALLIDGLGQSPQRAFAGLSDAYGQPGPALQAAGLIAPGRTRTGWVSFISPIWTGQVLHLRAADLEFLTPRDHVGQIRLWKYATPSGAAALGLRVPGGPGI